MSERRRGRSGGASVSGAAPSEDDVATPHQPGHGHGFAHSVASLTDDATAYNPCQRCRDDESNLRVAHAVNSLRTLDLAPLAYCDEARPTCARCVAAGRGPCAYRTQDASLDTIAELERLQYQLDCKTRDLNVVVLLLRILRHSSDSEATAALARLRLSTEVQPLIAALREGDTVSLRSTFEEPPSDQLNPFISPHETSPPSWLANASGSLHSPFDSEPPHGLPPQMPDTSTDLPLSYWSRIQALDGLDSPGHVYAAPGGAPLPTADSARALYGGSTWHEAQQTSYGLPAAGATRGHAPGRVPPWGVPGPEDGEPRDQQ